MRIVLSEEEFAAILEKHNTLILEIAKLKAQPLAFSLEYMAMMVPQSVNGLTPTQKEQIANFIRDFNPRIK